MFQALLQTPPLPLPQTGSQGPSTPALLSPVVTVVGENSGRTPASSTVSGSAPAATIAGGDGSIEASFEQPGGNHLERQPRWKLLESYSCLRAGHLTAGSRTAIQFANWRTRTFVARSTASPLEFANARSAEENCRSGRMLRTPDADRQSLIGSDQLTATL